MLVPGPDWGVDENGLLLDNMEPINIASGGRAPWQNNTLDIEEDRVPWMDHSWASPTFM